jgi:hypothetical protein
MQSLTFFCECPWAKTVRRTKPMGDTQIPKPETKQPDAKQDNASNGKEHASVSGNACGFNLKPEDRPPQFVFWEG